MDWLFMHMPIAGVDIFWPGLVLIGFAVGVIGGFFGMGGAWMVTPGLNILGFPMAFAIGTDIAHIAGKSMISTIRHSKFGNVDYKLGIVMLVGTMTGIECGAQIVMWLERLGQVGKVVRWVYVVFLLLIALMVFSDYFKARQKKNDPAASCRDRRLTLASEDAVQPTARLIESGRRVKDGNMLNGGRHDGASGPAPVRCRHGVALAGAS